MSFFCNTLFNIMVIVLPISIILILITYFFNYNEKQKNILLDIACLTSTYVIVKYNVCLSYRFLILLVNIPILICYLKKRLTISIVISLILSYYYKYVFSLNIYVVFLEYFIYIIIFFMLLKKDNFHIIIFIFTVIKCAILGFCFKDINNYMDISMFIISIILFFTMSYVVYILAKRASSAVSINSAMKKLNKEKELRISLFKITHEVKNPLAVCKGYLSMIDFNDKTKSEKYLNIIKSEIGRTLDILDNFSEYTKININKEKMDLSILLSDTFIDLKELFVTNKINFVNNINISNAFINGDYNRLKQVIVNVLKNSIESIKDNGIIKINLVQNKNKYIISIIDNGVGMDKETLKSIGEMFFTTKNKGTGIGVCLSKEIIKQHGGEIIYTSKLGEGTTVKIILPKM